MTMITIPTPTLAPYDPSDPMSLPSLLIDRPLDMHNNPILNASYSRLKELIIVPPSSYPAGIYGDDGGSTTVGSIKFHLNGPGATGYQNTLVSSVLHMLSANVGDPDIHGLRFWWYNVKNTWTTAAPNEWLSMYPQASPAGADPYNAVCINARAAYSAVNGSLLASSLSYNNALCVQHWGSNTASVSPALKLVARSIATTGVLNTTAVGFGVSLTLSIQPPSSGGTTGETRLGLITAVMTAKTGGNAVDTADLNFYIQSNFGGGDILALKLRGISGTATQGVNLMASTLEGGTASGGNLTITTTSHATKGKLLIGTSAYDEVNNRLGIANNAPAYPLDVTGKAHISTEIEIDGDINHDGSNVGVFGVAPTTQKTGGENVTNSVTDSGSTAGTIPDITDGVLYANDYTNLRRALFQLARILKQDHDALRAYGFLT